MRATCQFCREEMDVDRFTWHHIEGWERPGKAGGSDVMLRKRTGKGFAHDLCLQRTKDGVSVRQETLI